MGDQVDGSKVRKEYLSRIYAVMDYVEQNLDQALSLEKLAKVANFSPFHFHRIFGAMTGETLFHFIGRLRLERAASQLTENRNKSITEIGIDAGFASSATFARSFKQLFGMSASQWRTHGHSAHSTMNAQKSNLGKLLRNGCKDYLLSAPYLDGVTRNMNWRITMKNAQNEAIEVNVEIKDLSEMNVAYVRHIGPYAGDENLFGSLFGKLMGWAGPRDLLASPDLKAMAVYHDDPSITDESNLRTSVCITVPQGTKVEGEIGSMTVPGGKFAVAHFELAAQEYANAWQAVWSGWFPDSGFQPDDRLCYELFLNDPKEHPEHKHIVDICVPVKPL